MSIVKDIVETNDVLNEPNKLFVIFGQPADSCLGWIDHVKVFEFDIWTEEIDQELDDVTLTQSILCEHLEGNWILSDLSFEFFWKSLMLLDEINIVDKHVTPAMFVGIQLAKILKID